MDCEQLKFDLAADALAGRDEPGSPALASHLETCPPCRGEQEELREVVRLLSGMAPHEWDGVPAPDPERAIARLRAGTAPQPPPDSGRAKQPADIAWWSRTYVALTAAFAAGVLAGGGVLTPLYGNERFRERAKTTGTARTLRVFDPGTGVRATVGLHDMGWGTEVLLSLAGVTGPRRCSLVTMSVSGRCEVVSNWSVPEWGYGAAGASDALRVTGSSSLGLRDIAAFEVRASDGSRLLRISL
ncbi:hypothetical protein [Streptomyces sp. NPDC052015]|uniref:hypothetical protein n=1 Tax=Streptomyces sp. NPDC052015 TaxID=3154755 RepID=UPI00343FC3DC